MLLPVHIDNLSLFASGRAMTPTSQDLETSAAGALRLSVAEAEAGERLDRWLAARAPGLTRSRWKALIKEGFVAQDGAPVLDPSRKVVARETYDARVPAPEPAAPRPEKIPLDILYEDEDLIVVNKPPGLVVHPAAGNWTGTLVNALLAHCGADFSGVGGVMRPGIVHRLDKDTSGALVVAKNDLAHQGLTAAFAARDLERAYEAAILGAPRPMSGRIDAAIARATSDRKKMRTVKPDAPGARRAVTHYRVLASYGRSRARLPGDAVASLAECRLETGRTHQIRVHMAHIGHPVIGDPVYGPGAAFARRRDDDETDEAALAVCRQFKRQALHARTLGFAHPCSGESLVFEAPRPDDFQRLISALESL
ncbi:MAG: RluA family pseudouridine synthase [Parvularculaceae bacterium]